MNARISVLTSLVGAFSLLIVTGSRSDEPAKAERVAADPMLGKKAGQERDDNGLEMKLVWCPPGFVTMEQVARVEEDDPVDDSPDEDESDEDDRPAENANARVRRTRTVDKITLVKVLVTRGYWLGKYEVTQFQWKRLMETETWKGKKQTKEGEDFPAAWISWEDAMEFCRTHTGRERKEGRLPQGWEYTLPTDAQWERACRCRTETRFSFGDNEAELGEYAWYGNNATSADEDYAHPVGQKKGNPWGLHDMHGNVWEWCRDWWGDDLPRGRDPERTVKIGPSRVIRVIRGGCWYETANRCRSGSRLAEEPSARKSGAGFRVALSEIRQAEAPRSDK